MYVSSIFKSARKIKSYRTIIFDTQTVASYQKFLSIFIKFYVKENQGGGTCRR